MLRAEQDAFLAAVLSGVDIPSIRAGRLSVSRRSGIYRHNVFTNLGNALADVTPVVRRIVGDAFFRAAAEVYIRESPSRSGDLNDFGRSWPDFLACYPHVQELPYLADVARLEWAWHESFHAADASPLTLAALAAIGPEQWETASLVPHPAFRWIRSAFPVVRIWTVNQPEYQGSLEIDWSLGGEDALLTRDGPAVQVRILPAGHAALLDRLLMGESLLSAVSAAADLEANDLQGMLGDFVQWQIFTATRTLP